jgi:copper chaperone
MKTLLFKTNINCSGCEAKIAPALHEAKGINKWQVDVTNPVKILTVETADLTASEVIAIINKAGFNAEAIQQ